MRQAGEDIVRVERRLAGHWRERDECRMAEEHRGDEMRGKRAEEPERGRKFGRGGGGL